MCMNVYVLINTACACVCVNQEVKSTQSATQQAALVALAEFGSAAIKLSQNSDAYMYVCVCAVDVAVCVTACVWCHTVQTRVTVRPPSGLRLC